MNGIVVGVLAHNAIVNLRMGMLDETIASLREAFGDLSAKEERRRMPPTLVLDNGSTDGTTEWLLAQVPERLAACGVHRGDNASPGRGRNRLVELLGAGAAPDVSLHGDLRVPDDPLVVLTDDDMHWSPYVGAKLRKFWSEAPAKVALVSGLLEPIYDWNEPTGTIECGGVRALVRHSVPAAAWCFPLSRWSLIGPLREKLDGIGEDYHACLRIRGAGSCVAAMDLATHLGAGVSTWGNKAGKGRPLDREHWGI